MDPRLHGDDIKSEILHFSLLMMYEVKLTKTAQKGFFALPKNLQQKCRNVLKSLETNPERGKKLVGTLKKYRSIRLTNYRIIYRKEKKKLIILVISIAHRKEVYRKLEK